VTVAADEACAVKLEFTKAGVDANGATNGVDGVPFPVTENGPEFVIVRYCTSATGVPVAVPL
jgi:hypothetical protein